MPILQVKFVARQVSLSLILFIYALSLSFSALCTLFLDVCCFGQPTWISHLGLPQKKRQQRPLKSKFVLAIATSTVQAPGDAARTGFIQASGKSAGDSRTKSLIVRIDRSCNGPIRIPRKRPDINETTTTVKQLLERYAAMGSTVPASVLQPPAAAILSSDALAADPSSIAASSAAAAIPSSDAPATADPSSVAASSAAAAILSSDAPAADPSSVAASSAAGSTGAVNPSVKCFEMKWDTLAMISSLIGAEFQNEEAPGGLRSTFNDRHAPRDK